MVLTAGAAAFSLATSLSYWALSKWGYLQESPYSQLPFFNHVVHASKKWAFKAAHIGARCY